MAAQSVSASDADLDMVHSDDFNLDDSQELSSIDLSDGNYDISSNWENEEIIQDDGVTVDDEGSFQTDFENEDLSQTDFENVAEEDNRNRSSISADPISFDYSSEGELSINLTDENGVGLSNRNISVKINNVQTNLSTNNDGIAIFRYSGAVGTYNVLLSFDGDESYAPSSANTEITITKAKTKLIVPFVRAYLTRSTYVNITLVDSNGLPLANKKVSLILSGVTYNASTNRNGFVKIKIPTLEGDFNFTVRFEGDANYLESSRNGRALITRMRTYLKVPEINSYVTRDSYLKIYLRNIYNKALANMPVYVTIGKKTYELTTNEKGFCQLKLDKKLGTFNCLVKFKATDTYCVAFNRTKVVISKTPAVIKAPEIRFDSSKYGVFKINLTDIDGKPLGKRVLSVNLSSIKKVFKVKTNSKGIATLKISSAFTYHVVIKFAGDNSYASSSAKSALHVNKIKVKFNDVVGASKVLYNYIFEKRAMPS